MLSGSLYLLGITFFLNIFLCNPRQHKTSANYQLTHIFSVLGPIIELQDINLMDFWGSLGDKEVCEELSENVILSQTEISEGEILGHEPVDDYKQETDRMSTSVTEGIVEATDLDGDTIYSEKSTHEDTKTEREAEPETVVRQDEALPGSASAENSLNIDGEPGPGKSEESILGREPEMETKPEGDHTSATEPGSEGQVSQEDSGVTESAPEATSTASGDGAVTDTGVTDSQQDTPAAEAVQEAPASNQSQSDQETSSETRLKGEDLLPDQGKGKVFFFLTDLNNFQCKYLDWVNYRVF